MKFTIEFSSSGDGMTAKLIRYSASGEWRETPEMLLRSQQQQRVLALCDQLEGHKPAPGVCPRHGSDRVLGIDGRIYCRSCRSETSSGPRRRGGGRPEGVRLVKVRASLAAHGRITRLQLAELLDVIPSVASTLAGHWVRDGKLARVARATWALAGAEVPRAAE